jgi:hypothetical protein
LAGRQLPLLAEVRRPDGGPQVWALASVAGKDDETPPLARIVPNHQARRLAPLAEREDTSPPLGTIEDIVTAVFDLEEPPRFVLVVSESDVFLCERSKWAEQRLLRFDLAEILGRRDDATLQLTAALLHRSSLAPAEGPVVLDDFDDNSHKHAFAVSEDLKYALRECIEALGNEAVRQLRARHEKLFTEDRAAELARECMRYMYRLLFLFYVEARPELGWAPLGVEAWTKGYGLDRLRAFEQLDLTTEEERAGTYLHECLALLFRMVFEGAQPAAQLTLGAPATSTYGIFELSPLKSHLFDPNRTPLLNTVEFPNHVLQQVIEKMSLSREGGASKRRGRISYATLGISQLGAVYEALLSFRGFFAREPLYELYPKGKSPGPLDPTWFVTEAQLGEYSDDEKLGEKAKKGGARPGLKRYEPGTFIYRMSGRDRQKSASYYTPQSLTKATVEYTLQEVIFDEHGKEKLSADELLQLTVLEPAVGSAAFLNEAIDQLAEAYLHRKQRELGKRIPHDQYAHEKQRVKMYIGDRNVFGIDLNPIAIELAEVSLWLNTIHRGAYVPWFGTQLVRGNSLIGGRRDVWTRDQVIGEHRAWLKDVPSASAGRREAARGRDLALPAPRRRHGGLRRGHRGPADQGPVREAAREDRRLADRGLRGARRRRAPVAGRAVGRYRSALGLARRGVAPHPCPHHGPDGDLRPGAGARRADDDRAEGRDLRSGAGVHRREGLEPVPPAEAGDGLLVRAVVLADRPGRPAADARGDDRRPDARARRLAGAGARHEQRPGETRELFATTRPASEATEARGRARLRRRPAAPREATAPAARRRTGGAYGFLHQELEFADTFADRSGLRRDPREPAVDSHRVEREGRSLGRWTPRLR